MVAVTGKVVMEAVKRRVDNLELRTCNAHLTLEGEHVTAEIVQWADSEPSHCWVVAYWVRDREGYYLRHVGDRPFDNKVAVQDFWDLAKRGQDLLNEWFIANCDD